MIIVISSVIILTLAIWLGNKILPKKICPICAGVTLTWLSFFAMIFLGKIPSADYLLPSAILAGGTVVGVMSKLESKIKEKNILPWKTIFVVSGFLGVYGITVFKIEFLFLGLSGAVVSTIVFKKYEHQKNKERNITDLKEKFKECC